MRTLMSAPPTSRVGRYPKHPFIVNAKPFTLQPIGIARVLPGETLKDKEDVLAKLDDFCEHVEKMSKVVKDLKNNYAMYDEVKKFARNMEGSIS